MTSIAQNQEKDQREISATLRKFYADYGVAGLLRACRGEKQKGYSAFRIFQYLLCLVFSDRSMYMQLATGRFAEAFGKNTVYRFLSAAKTNWERFVLQLSERIINRTIRPLTSEERKDVFIVDDTLFARTGGKKTELCSRVFDHVSMKYRRGYRLLTLGWSDGNSFLPISGQLLASGDEKKVVGPKNEADQRSLAGKRRKQATGKAPDVMVEMLKAALRAGHQARYVLSDIWFASPKAILRILRECRLNTIAMVKKTSKVIYELDGRRMNIKQIFAASKKRRGRSKYLLSVDVTLTDRKGNATPARIVCVRNRNNRKDWIAFISTDVSLAPEEILRIYGKRWDIEVFFKTCKSMLHLGSECHCLSYDALNAHVALVFIRYMLLSLQKRRNEDDRTIGELFLLMVDELADTTFAHAMQLIVDAMLQTVRESFGLTEAQLLDFARQFYDRLPASYRHFLQVPAAA